MITILEIRIGSADARVQCIRDSLLAPGGSVCLSEASGWGVNGFGKRGSGGRSGEHAWQGWNCLDSTFQYGMMALMPNRNAHAS